MITDATKQLIETEIPKLEGWTTPERCLEMAGLIHEQEPTIVVEIGVFGARTLIAQALALKELGHGVVVGIDPWKKEAALEGESGANEKWWSEVDLHSIHKGAMESVWRLGLDKHALVVRSKSEDCLPLFVAGIDMLFIDGNHSEVASCRDVVNYLPLVWAGGYVIFDDANWPTTQKALNMISEHCDLVKDAGNYRIYRKLKRD